MTGMRTKMENGDHPEFLIQNIEVHGNLRYIHLLWGSVRETLLTLHVDIKLMEFLLILQRIKNPNYKGKWKIPWIDNPGKACCRH